MGMHTSMISRTLPSTDVFTELIAFSAHFFTSAIEQSFRIRWEKRSKLCL
uniref:AlNc14C158G7698 protein n=1 Tax=Albugo laibachii Nc14 TaxID=890382 RepID=F0WMK8_9STRA|nr:AlNc14C158G7698 [Albugo laibachii Nc14]|eukprot:CCA22540.1 AlNc14C158G7698 [Albugo laibachii Nc14]